MGPYKSGEVANASHIYTYKEPPAYSLVLRVKDTNGNQCPSYARVYVYLEWRSRNIQRFNLANILENHFPFLSLILKMLAKIN